MSELRPTSLTLDLRVQQSIAALSGLPGSQVIRGNEDHPRPSGLYATYLFMYDSGNDSWTNYLDVVDDNRQVDETALDAESVIPVVSAYSINFFRTGARDAARRCRHMMRSKVGRETVRGFGLTLGDIADVRNMDMMIASEHEERAQLDMMVLFNETLVNRVATWDGARFTLVYEEPGSALPGVVTEEEQIHG